MSDTRRISNSVAYQQCKDGNADNLRHWAEHTTSTWVRFAAVICFINGHLDLIDELYYDSKDRSPNWDSITGVRAIDAIVLWYARINDDRVWLYRVCENILAFDPEFETGELFLEQFAKNTKHCFQDDFTYRERDGKHYVKKVALFSKKWWQL